MYFKYLLLAFKKYKWFYAPFLILFILVALNFFDYEKYKFIVFNLDFEISDFIYHNVIIPFLLSVIASIIFYILNGFGSEYKKDILTLEFLNDLKKVYNKFNEEFNESLLEKEVLFKVVKKNGRDVEYVSDGILRKGRNITIILNHCGIVFRSIDDLLKLGVADAEILMVLKNIKHSKFMVNYEMIFLDIWDKQEILPFEIYREYDKVGVKTGITMDLDESKQAYRDYLLNFKKIDEQIDKFKYFI